MVVALVVVELVAIRFAMVAVEVTVILPAVRAKSVAAFEVRLSMSALVALRLVVVTPPKNVTAIDVVAPRAVTVASVSVEYIERQLVPLARQTF